MENGMCFAKHILLSDQINIYISQLRICNFARGKTPAQALGKDRLNEDSSWGEKSTSQFAKTLYSWFHLGN